MQKAFSLFAMLLIIPKHRPLKQSRIGKHECQVTKARIRLSILVAEATGLSITRQLREVAMPQ